jgi:N-acetyl-anhydromuramyl-L-alanine amidase AmpD
MEIVKKHLTNGQYLTQEYEKKSIFIHHTAGRTAMGAWGWWNTTPDRVGTPYIIDRDGTIIECFDPKMWAFHLGVPHDDNYHEKYSVNIEIAACGRLYHEEGEYRFYPIYPNKLQYTVIPDSEVYVFKDEWRGQKYFHKYTKAQLDSLAWLLKKICLEDFPSIKVNPVIDDFYEFNEEVLTDHLGGIWSHSTVRKDKDDIYPGTDTLTVLANVNSEIYASQNVKAKEAVKVPKTPKP